MELITVIAAVAIGLAVGAVIAWLLTAKFASARLDDLRRRLAETEAGLSEAEKRSETLDTELQGLRITEAKASVEAERVPGLERRLSEAQAEATELATQKAAQDLVAARVPKLEDELAAEKAQTAQLMADKAALETKIAKEQEGFDEKMTALTALRGEIEKEIKNLAGEALKGNEKSFLNLANEVFEKHRETAVGDFELRKKAIETLLDPMAKTLEEYQKGLSELERHRLEAYVGLATELKSVAQAQTDVRNETSKLVNALRAAPKTRGRWGERQLQNVMELSGMTAYVDFQTEVTFERDDTKLRPDAVIRMPGSRHLVVDAKTSMSAYLDALEATDDETRETLLQRHAQQVRTHMKQLSGKSYWDSLASIGVSPDFVVMFVPGENLFAAAIERDPDLFEDGVSGRVLIATPTTLVALAKAIAFGWRQEKVAENARHISMLGRDLYRRLSTMGGHVASVGKSLGSAVGHYNKLVGGLEGSVMPQARRFNELEVEGTQDALEEIAPVEVEVRELREGKDLSLLEPPEATVLLGS